MIVLSTGTLGAERLIREARLRALGTRPLRAPHDIEEVAGELARSQLAVA